MKLATLFAAATVAVEAVAGASLRRYQILEDSDRERRDALQNIVSSKHFQRPSSQLISQGDMGRPIPLHKQRKNHDFQWRIPSIPVLKTHQQLSPLTTHPIQCIN